VFLNIVCLQFCTLLPRVRTPGKIFSRMQRAHDDSLLAMREQNGNNR
jgi:hypothetical protein